MARLTSPNLRIDWYPEDHFSNPVHPTIAELNSGYNLSRAIATGSSVDFVDPTTENLTTVFDMFTSEGILVNGYEANLQFFLNPKDAAIRIPEQDQAEQLFYNAHTPVGYIGKRFGYPASVDYDADDTILTTDLFKVQADLPKLHSDDNGAVLLDIEYIPQGEAFRIHLINYVTYNDVYQRWQYNTYSQVQDVYTGRTYNNVIESF